MTSVSLSGRGGLLRALQSWRELAFGSPLGSLAAVLAGVIVLGALAFGYVAAAEPQPDITTFAFRV